ncbi:MAG: NHLP leader peptide family natural product precursor [Chlamydiae bacterium]|nr:NHLP leader peptide family natural product precursor [Chlamydiota bacterium]
MENEKNIWKHIEEKAIKDENFRKKLKNDPKNTLKAEGLNVQDSCNITILENTEHDKYLVLPEVNQNAKKSLKNVSGGFNTLGCW